MFWTVGIGVLIVALILVVLARRGMQVMKLAHHGVATEGKALKLPPL